MNAKELGAMPARPMAGTDHLDAHNTGWGGLGLTKREAFAMAAMQGICAAEQHGHANWAAKARGAIAVADALLAELAKDQP